MPLNIDLNVPCHDSDSNSAELVMIDCNRAPQIADSNSNENRASSIDLNYPSSSITGFPIDLNVCASYEEVSGNESEAVISNDDVDIDEVQAMLTGTQQDPNDVGDEEDTNTLIEEGEEAASINGHGQTSHLEHGQTPHSYPVNLQQ